MIFRATSALIVLFTFAACTPQGPSRDEVWEIIEGCDGNERCAFATLATNEYNKIAGKPLGHGISVRGAKTDGKVVSLAVNVPERIKSEPTRDGRTAEQQLAYSVKKDLCGKKTTRRFFEIGGELEFSTYLPSGERFSKSTVDSC
ncbi:hypothetical protein LCM27_03600 [Ruegeria marisrubri]|uniref:hypothetical protein n=1 Tax=Ruegeria marisrubri TaxID=1685379 RepID=UPI001CD311B6|nr:hypothetical protein [Ruegeria marisrubri]MCA0905475.1 hypothetical protein [Ruegeria marisrubri]